MILIILKSFRIKELQLPISLKLSQKKTPWFSWNNWQRTSSFVEGYLISSWISWEDWLYIRISSQIFFERFLDIFRRLIIYQNQFSDFWELQLCQNRLTENHRLYQGITGFMITTQHWFCQGFILYHSPQTIFITIIFTIFHN